jgi:hypothetical protein
VAKGYKTGGRTAGTPNRKTKEVAELLRSLDCNPIEGMARIALDETNTPELRGKMYAELAPYLYAKRKALELSSEDGPVQLQVSWQTGPPASSETAETSDSLAVDWGGEQQ